MLLSALKHGFFKSGFMLCDRCAWNGECPDFRPKGECLQEKRVFHRFVSKLMEEFDLDTVADRVLVERAAMYLIRIARAEAYEAAVGVSDKSALWGAYITRLDNTLRGLLNDLAVTRARRRRLDKTESLLVSVDEVLRKFVKESQPKMYLGGISGKRMVLSATRRLLESWRRESRKLGLTAHHRGERSVG